MIRRRLYGGMEKVAPIALIAPELPDSTDKNPILWSPADVVKNDSDCDIDIVRVFNTKRIKDSAFIYAIKPKVYINHNFYYYKGVKSYYVHQDILQSDGSYISETRLVDLNSSDAHKTYYEFKQDSIHRWVIVNINDASIGASIESKDATWIFSGFSNRVSCRANFPSNVKYVYISRYSNSLGSFSGCKNLKGRLVFPDVIKKIILEAFRGCLLLTGTLDTNKIEETGSACFAGNNFKKLIISSNLINMAINTFEDTQNFSNSVEEIEIHTKSYFTLNFRNRGLKSITLKDNAIGVYELDYGGQILYYKGNGLVNGVADGSQPYQLMWCKKLLNEKWKGNKTIEPIVINEECEQINYQSFYETLSINEKEILTCKIDFTKANKLKTIGSNAFKSTKINSELTLNDNINKIEDWAFSDSLFKDNFIIPKSLTYMGRSILRGSKQITSINIHQGAKMIGFQMIYDTCVTEIDIPDSVSKMLGPLAIWNLSELTKVRVHWIGNKIIPYNEVVWGNMSIATLYVPDGTISDYTSATNNYPLLSQNPMGFKAIKDLSEYPN